jgi:hypothetical protein
MIRILQVMSTRERVMLTAFLLVILLIWASRLSDRWTEAGETLREARRTVAHQAIWLSSANRFEAQLKETLAALDPEAMLDANGLTAFVDSYAREHKLRHEMTAPQVRTGRVFTQSTVRVTFRNLSLEDLIRLQIAIDAKRPYLASEGLALAANRADPRLLNARMTLTSMQLRQP